MSRDKPRKGTGSSALLATGAGGGGGTLLVQLARNMPDDSPWQSWLLILAPWVSAGLSGVWLWTKPQVDGYMDRRRIRKAMQETEETLNAATHISEAEKALYRQRLGEIQKHLVEQRLEGMMVQVGYSPEKAQGQGRSSRST